MTKRPRQLEEAIRRRTGAAIPALELHVALGVAADIVVVPRVRPDTTPLAAKLARGSQKHRDQVAAQLLYEQGHTLVAIGTATGKPPRVVRHTLGRLEQRATVGTQALVELQVARTVMRARMRYMVRR